MSATLTSEKSKPVSMLEIAAMCHREKWQFEATPAFDILHRIGDLARKAALAAPSAPVGEALRCLEELANMPLGISLEDWCRLSGPILSALRAAPVQQQTDYQGRVHKWMMACFNDEIAFSRQERNHRFLEEALELVQAMGCTKSEAFQLVDYVYEREIGEPFQEVGGVLVCLAALCTAASLKLDEAGEAELARIWTKVEKIRAKHSAKPQFSPLPGNPAATDREA